MVILLLTYNVSYKSTGGLFEERRHHCHVIPSSELYVQFRKAPTEIIRADTNSVTLKSLQEVGLYRCGNRIYNAAATWKNVPYVDHKFPELQDQVNQVARRLLKKDVT